MNNGIRCGLMVAIAVLFSHFSFSQIAVADLSLDGDLSVWYYDTYALDNSPLGEGVYYVIASQSFREHQFYQSAVWTEGEITISGESFEGIRLLYNIYQDLLLVENRGRYRASYLTLEPNQRKISEFVIHGAEFVNIQESSVPSRGRGFYHKIYQGESLGFYAKRSKKSVTGSRSIQYEPENVRYVRAYGEYVKYVGKKTFYTLFPERKKEIKQFVKSKLKTLSRKDEQGAVLVLEYCERFVTDL
ncbi:hypothetical protein BFP72_04085 [Reichenbachiella sp. 5M10]|uniref:hypothetical protein n=1 Tax=Reichenbachiella sp. 5M10 TaxID=1889772 RepID=UPI000C155D15|nr:hypothetical protein [Reichenbachiella sp. 5M10]PIB34646.1 hypothetical protein BFP72_04085 [Reichenbachiella sp. 5M10]